MIRRIGRRKFKIYSFDIESHNDEETIAKMETSMWLGCLIDEDSKIDDEESYLYSMEEFVDRIEEMSSAPIIHGKRPINNIAIYVYNLSFEWSFLLPVLLKRGYEFSPVVDKTKEKVYSSVSTHSVSSVWEVKIQCKRGKGLVLLRDLAKIYGGGLGKVAKSFGLQTQKGEIDYRLNRLHNYQITKEEKEYCFKDTKIVMEILEEMNRRDDKQFFKAMSMASYSMAMMIKKGFPRSVKPYAEFRKKYPRLEKEETEFLRKSVSGGLCYPTRDYQYKIINEDIVHIDGNSLHPSSAYLNVFPYGKGEYHKGKPTNYTQFINCCRIRISYDRAILHSVIKLIGNLYIDDLELVVWDFEIPTMYKCYEGLKVEYIDYYAYHTSPLAWKRYYKEMYNKRLDAKAKGDEFNKLYYKLLMNSSYGKLLENPHLETFANIVDEEGIITSEVFQKEKPEDMKEEDWELACCNSKYTYLPVGSCIPAYSRVALIELALKISPTAKEICYFDTDSIFFIKTPETMTNMDKFMNKEDFLGGWKIEEIGIKGQFTAPKRYKIQTEEGNSYVKSGGINFTQYIREKAIEQGLNTLEEQSEFIKKYEVDFDEINIVSSKWKVQRAFRCKGGTIIDFQEKEISVPKKYIDIYEKNINI